MSNFTPIVNADSRKNDKAIWNDPMTELSDAIGDLPAMTTTIKTSAAAAISEVDGNADAAAASAAAAASSVDTVIAKIGTAASASGTLGVAIDTDGTLKAGAVDASTVLVDNVVSADKIADNVIGATYTAGVDQTLKEVSDKTPITGPDNNNVDLEDAVTDSSSVEALGVTGDGDVRVAGSLHMATGKNNIGQDALTDARDRLVFGVSERGRLIGDFRPDYLGCDINHILMTGQSLSIGDWGGPALSTTQPYGNLQFIGGSGNNMGEFIPLVEPCYRDVILKHGSAGGGTATVETPGSAMANLISELVYDATGARTYHRALMSLHGIGASNYSVIKRGGSGDAYNLGMQQITAAHNLAMQKRLSYRVAAVTVAHGEADLANATYDVDMQSFQRDYESDVFAITGQHDPVPMIFMQFSSWTAYGYATSAGALAQYRAAKNNPGRLFLAGPEYCLNYNSADTGGKHLSNIGYSHMGEYFAKVYQRVVVERRAWWPVMPSFIWRDGANVYVQFHVPKPPLRFDTTTVTDPSGGAYGFEYTDDTTSATISSVSIVRDNVVKITLSGTPTGANKKIAYAYTGTPAALAGPTTGPRGNLCDSDFTRSRFGYNLSNWGVSFQEAIS